MVAYACAPRALSVHFELERLSPASLASALTYSKCLRFPLSYDPCLMIDHTIELHGTHRTCERTHSIHSPFVHTDMHHTRTRVLSRQRWTHRCEWYALVLYIRSVVQIDFVSVSLAVLS